MDADGVKGLFEYFFIIFSIILRLWKVSNFLVVSFKVGSILLILFNKMFDSIQGLSLDLKWIIGFYFTEQQRPNNMSFHSFRLFQELSKLCFTGLDSDSSCLDNFFNEFLFTLTRINGKNTYRFWHQVSPSLDSKLVWFGFCQFFILSEDLLQAT